MWVSASTWASALSSKPGTEPPKLTKGKPAVVSRTVDGIWRSCSRILGGWRHVPDTLDQVYKIVPTVPLHHTQGVGSGSLCLATDLYATYPIMTRFISELNRHEMVNLKGDKITELKDKWGCVKASFGTFYTEAVAHKDMLWPKSVKMVNKKSKNQAWNSLGQRGSNLPMSVRIQYGTSANATCLLKKTTSLWGKVTGNNKKGWNKEALTSTLLCWSQDFDPSITFLPNIHVS